MRLRRFKELKILKDKDHLRKVDIVFFKEGISYREIHFIYRISFRKGDTGNSRQRLIKTLAWIRIASNNFSSVSLKIYRQFFFSEQRLAWEKFQINSSNRNETNKNI